MELKWRDEAASGVREGAPRKPTDHVDPHRLAQLSFQAAHPNLSSSLSATSRCTGPTTRVAELQGGQRSGARLEAQGIEKGGGDDDKGRRVRCVHVREVRENERKEKESV